MQFADSGMSVRALSRRFGLSSPWQRLMASGQVTEADIAAFISENLSPEYAPER